MSRGTDSECSTERFDGRHAIPANHQGERTRPPCHCCNPKFPFLRQRSEPSIDLVARDPRLVSTADFRESHRLEQTGESGRRSLLPGAPFAATCLRSTEPTGISPSASGKNMMLQQLPVSAHARRLALHRHVGLKITLRQVGDGRLPLRLGYLRHGIFARLDAVDDRRGGLAGLLSGDVSVLAHRDAPRSRWTSTLHDVGLAPRGVKSHTEPRQVPVPVHTGPAMGRQGSPKMWIK